jgi:oxygen-dependent protoporphyrinogen oxidase
MTPDRVVVIGGGITGLAAAWSLGRAGVPTLLLEASGRLGGKIRTEVTDGFVIDHGPDSFITYKPGVIRLARSLGLEDEIIRPREPRTVYIRTRGRLRRMPDGMGMALPTRIRPFLTTDLFTPLDKLRMGLDLLLPRDSRTGDLAVGDFLERRLGHALVDHLAGPLIGGVYGTPVEELSLDAVVPTLRASEREHRSLLLASLADGRARTAAAAAAVRAQAIEGADRPASPPSPFVAMARGTGQLVEALAAAVRTSSGVDVRLDCVVGGVEASEAGAVVQTRDGARIPAAAVIVATEGPATADIVADLAPEAAVAVRAIPHVTTVVVNLAYPDGEVPEDRTGHGFLVGDDEPLSIGACTLSSRKWPGRAPDGMLLARAFLQQTQASGADPTPMSDPAIVSLVHRDIAATLEIGAAPVMARVSRFPGVMPQYTVGHLDRVARAEAALSRATPAVRLAGSAFRGAGLPDCIAQGEAAAAGVLQLLSATGPLEAGAALSTAGGVR